MSVFRLVFFSIAFVFQLSAQDSLLVVEVNFDLDSYYLNREQRVELDSILEIAPVDFMRKVYIYGHTDTLADLDYNRTLSKNRVISVLNYLVVNGLDPLKVKTDYYGEERPKYANTPEEIHKNRRVELVVELDIASIPEPEQELKDIELKTGDKIQIPNLNFVGNQSIPVWQSFDILEQLLLLLRQNPEMEIELQGHVCCSDNQELSMQRAQMVYAFLRNNGIDKNRMSFKGYSNTRPLFKESSEKEKALNRRVEVLVTKNTDKRVKVNQGSDVDIDVRTRVVNVSFFPNGARLSPSGDFMLGLVVDMLKESKGLKYEFVVYNNIDNKKVTAQRVKAISRKLNSAGVSRNVCSVDQQAKPRRMPVMENDNYIILKIKK